MKGLGTVLYKNNNFKIQILKISQAKFTSSQLFSFTVTNCIWISLIKYKNEMKKKIKWQFFFSIEDQFFNVKENRS